MSLFKLVTVDEVLKNKQNLHYSMSLFKRLFNIQTANTLSIYITVCLYLNRTTCHSYRNDIKIYITVCLYLNIEKETYSNFADIFTLQYVSI